MSKIVKTKEEKPTSTKPSVAKPIAEKKTRTTFTVKTDSGCKVYLAGSFNDWNPETKELTDKKGDGTYSGILCLAKGAYQYKFVIDGTWCADPECSDWEQNDLGTLNSVKHVK